MHTNEHECVLICVYSCSFVAITRVSDYALPRLHASPRADTSECPWRETASRRLRRRPTTQRGRAGIPRPVSMLPVDRATAQVTPRSYRSGRRPSLRSTVPEILYGSHMFGHYAT